MYIALGKAVNILLLPAFEAKKISKILWAGATNSLPNNIRHWLSL